MSSIDLIGNAVTSQLVSVALDAALTRHAAIAANIANAGTPGYQPLKASFDDLVSQLRETATDRSRDATSSRVADNLHQAMTYQPLAIDPRSSKVELDVQMAKLSENTLQYQALLTAQSRLSSMTAFVIREGK